MILQSLYQAPRTLRLDSFAVADLQHSYDLAISKGESAFNWHYDNEKYRFDTDNVAVLLRDISDETIS